jgi:hypothetical protein
LAKLNLADQIAKAAAEGNLEKVKELAEKLKEVKPKAKAKPRKIKPHGEAIEVIDTASLPDYVVEAKSKNKKQTISYDGDAEDGEDRTVAQRAPFKPVKRKNTFQDNLADSAADIEFDKSWYKKTGDTPSRREKVKKIKVICSRCKEAKSTLSNDIIHASWVCNDCLSSLRRSR